MGERIGNGETGERGRGGAREEGMERIGEEDSEYDLGIGIKDILRWIGWRCGERREEG